MTYRGTPTFESIHSFSQTKQAFESFYLLGQSLADDVGGVTFSTLTVLEKLDTSNNVVRDLPALNFQNNENVRVLNISYNELTQFATSLANNRKIETLDLSANLLMGLSTNTCLELRDIQQPMMFEDINI